MSKLKDGDVLKAAQAELESWGVEIVYNGTLLA